MYTGYLTDVNNIKVGHAEYMEAATGVTVVTLGKKGMMAGVDIRGSAPGTREIALLNPLCFMDKVNAIVLSGGSAFGLDSCSGVVKYLEENDIGYNTGAVKVPIVCGAVLYDLNIGDPKIRPDNALGYLAAKKANNTEQLQGNVGAGTGATVGKILGHKKAMKSGLGSASIKAGKLIVSAMVAVNAVGSIYDYTTNELMAGPYKKSENKIYETTDILYKHSNLINMFFRNTTIGIVATNAKLDKVACNKVAQMANNGYARSIKPVNTLLDGDAIFTVSSGEITANTNIVGTMAAEVMSQAIYNAIINAESMFDVPSYTEIKGKSTL